MPTELGPEVTAFRLAFERECAAGKTPARANLGYDTFARRALRQLRFRWLAQDER